VLEDRGLPIIICRHFPNFKIQIYFVGLTHRQRTVCSYEISSTTDEKEPLLRNSRRRKSSPAFTTKDASWRWLSSGL
jgi:hypothetical protein